MKKLMTALAVCLAAGFAVAAPAGGSVVSSNIVGYSSVAGYGAGVFCGVVFEKVGGGTNTLSQQFDTSAMLDWVDNVAYFNPGDGTWPTYYYGSDVAGQFGTIGDPDMPIGVGILTQFSPATVKQIGQVHDTTQPFTHKLPAGASLMSSAWPVPMKLSKFDWSGLVPYADNIGFYNVGDGSIDTYYWDGTGFTQDFATYPLSDTIADIGVAILVGNSVDVAITENF